MAQFDHFQGKSILLAVTGGIAAYKSIFLASQWTQRGAKVHTLMTEAAQKFVTPLSFQSVTREAVSRDIWEAPADLGHRPEHIGASQEADLFIMAPATANSIAKAAHGFADDIVCLSLLAFQGKTLIAPAMNDKMWENPATQQNLALLQERGMQIIPPGTGHMACGSFGEGRLAELDCIDDFVSKALS